MRLPHVIWKCVACMRGDHARCIGEGCQCDHPKKREVEDGNGELWG